MVSLRKRALEDAAPAVSDAPKVSPELRRLRNMWQFACLVQWLYIFGPAIKLEAPDMDELEAQCLSPHSHILEEIGLALLKYLSSHRSLSNDLFDEYTRRQFTTKAPNAPNPFGTDEEPAKFTDFDAFKKIRVLHQMTLFCMINAEKLRDKMSEEKDADHDQTSWRIEPFGWDSNDDTYFVLDDNRVYRLKELTPPPPPPPKPKKNSKKARAEARRASKRRRVSAMSVEEETENDGAEADAEPEVEAEAGDEGLGNMKWECVAVSLDEMHQLLATIPGKKDANERILHKKIVDHLLPIIEQQEERRKKRDREREKEMLNQARLAHAKRSTRIAGRQEQIRQEELHREEEERRRREEHARRREEQKQHKLEVERDNRLMSRENRLRERELRRVQHQDELAQLSEDGKSVSSAGGIHRISERQRAADIERAKEALQKLQQEQEQEEWVFDCVCGLHGRVDDGQHSVSCERCNIWQHSRCLGIDEAEAEKDDFHFVCSSCRRRAHEAETGRSPIVVIKVKRPSIGSAAGVNGDGPKTNGTMALEPPKEDTSAGIPVKIDTTGPAVLTATAGKPVPDVVLRPAEVTNGNGTINHNPFSSPHPDLSPPGQSPRKTHAYETIYEQGSPTPVALPTYKATDRVLSPRLTMHAPTLLPRPTSGGPPSPGKPPSRDAPTNSNGIFPPPQPSSRPHTPSSVVMTPRLMHHAPHSGGHRQRAQTLSPLPSAHNGLSPTKQSPSIGVGGDLSASFPPFPSSSPTPPIFPPVAALSPSAPKQNPTPPIKAGGLVYRQSSGGPPSEVASSSPVRE